MDARRAAWQVTKLRRPRLVRPVEPFTFTSQIKLRLPLPASPFSPEYPSPTCDRPIGTDSDTSTLFAAWNYATVRGLYLRQISQLVSPSKGSMKVMFIDTLALVRRLESQGLTPKQAEAVTAAIIEVLNDSMDNVAQTFVSKPDMQKNEMTQEAALAKVQTEMQHSQDYKLSLLQREVERIRTDVEKMRSDLRYEIDKVTAGQRLDINLERGRTREDLSKQSAETSELTNKLDREIHSLKTQLETSKYEVIKYGIGTIVSLTAVGLGLLRILM